MQLYGDVDHASLQYLGEQLERDLLATDDIREVSAGSFVDPMMSIEIDEGKLQAYGLTLSDVADAVNQESNTALTTSLRNKEKVIRLKASEQSYWAKDFANIPLITDTNGVITHRWRCCYSARYVCRTTAITCHVTTVPMAMEFRCLWTNMVT